MDENNNRIEQKLDVLDMRIDAIDKTMVKQEINLRAHMKRSDQLEEIVSTIQSDLKPVQKHINMVEGVFKFIGVIAVLAGIAAAVFDIVRGAM